MHFTYESLKNLLASVQESGYEIVTYHDWRENNRCAILRHDVDYDPSKALELARRESEWGVRSTYFYLMTSPLYNAMSTEVAVSIRSVLEFGHEVGLHFDETRYPEFIGNERRVAGAILREAELLERISGERIRAVSMHRPSKWMLESDLEVPGMENSYSREFFHGFKYLSDSRRSWREPVEEIVWSGQYDRLHILTHAFWYDEEEKDIQMTVSSYVNRANADRYDLLSDNITDLESIMSRTSVL